MVGALKAHNKYRQLHHVSNLENDVALNIQATKWAKHLVKLGRMEHSKGTGTGENIYVSYTTGSLQTDNIGEKATDSWYDEIELYNFGNPGFSSETGHFTQVVWKGSTKVGCGYATGKTTMRGRTWNVAYVVCNYSPPGNYMRQFEKNVLPK